MSDNAKAALARYAVALASVIAASVLRELVDPLVGKQVPFITLFGAVAFSAWYGGLGPGMFAVACSVIAAVWMFIPPGGGFPRDAEGLTSLALFIAMASMIAWFFHRLGLARRGAERAAELLGAERERFRVTLSSIGDAVIVTDTGARVTFMNAIAERLTGWSTVDGMGQSLDRVFHIVNEGTRQIVESPVAKALREGTVVGLANHTSLIARDGSERAIDDSAAPIRDESGRVIGVVLVFRDVTERRGAQQTLLESEERFRTLFESSPLGKASVSALGRVLKANPAICELLGYDCSEFETLSLADVTHPEDREALAAAARDAQGGSRTFAIELRLQHKAGRIIWTRLIGRTIRTDSGPMSVVTVEDVTQRRVLDRVRALRLACNEILAREDDPSQAVLRTLRAVCEALEWEAGLYWTRDDSQDRLLCRETFAAAGRAQPFVDFSPTVTFSRGTGLPGRVWQTGESVWIQDFAAETTFPRAAQAERDGLHGAFGCPVHVGDDFLGVIEFFSFKIEQPDADLLELMTTIATQLGQYLEKKRAEEELRRSERELADFFENASIGLHWVGPEGTILRVNRAELEMLGYTREEYVGRPVADFHADPEVIRDILQRLLAGEVLNDAPARLRHKDGSIRHVLIDTSGLWQNGAFVHSRCFTRDVTRQREAEEKIRFQARLIESVEQAVVVTDARGVVKSLNAFAERLSGWPAGEAIGQELVSMLVPDDKRQSLARILERLHNGESWSGELTVQRRNGSLVPTLMTYTPVFEDGQGLTAILGVSTDISAQKRTEESLRFLSNASRSLADLVDYHSTLQRVASLAVPAFADWCAVDMLEPDGSVRRLATAHVDPDKVALVRRVAERRVLDPDAPRGLMRILRTGESELVSEISPEILQSANLSPESEQLLRDLHVRSYIGVPLIAHGNTFGALTFVWAESGRNYNEEDLRLAEDLAHRAAVAIENARLYYELRDADRRKDEFLAMLAHELRNPLAPIRTGLDILSMTNAGSRDVIDVMQRQVEHLVRLVDDLLDVSRIVGGRIELRREPVEISTIINRSVEAVRPAIERSGHQLRVSLPAEPIFLEADIVRMVQVVENLLNNACKYTEPGGTIDIIAEREPAGVRILVRDTGIGIEPELLPHVFDLFTQSDRTLDRSQGGLGIGLTLVRNLVEMHGGTVTAHSDGPGRGSEFAIRLPTAGALVAAPRPAPEAPRGDGAARRILVVEDNVGMARMVARLLSNLGPHQVELAHDGPSALAKLNGFRPDVVFLDIGLPGMDGYTIARAIRRDPANQRLLLIALTGYGQEDDRRRSREAGFDEHLVKPPALSSIQSVLAHPKLA